MLPDEWLFWLFNLIENLLKNILFFPSTTTQDSIDLFLGNFAVDEADLTTPLREPKDWKFLTVSLNTFIFCLLVLIQNIFLSQLPIIMVVAFSMCIICLLMAGRTIIIQVWKTIVYK